MPATEHVEIAIAGAGLSGLGLAMALKDDGRDDFVVLERAGDLGGTWRDNSYPGCACDIPSVLYSFADEPNPAWTQAFARQPEIWAYMRDVARRHDLAGHFRYDHEVTAAEWDEERQLWAIQTTGGDMTADVVVSATGALADPAIPRAPRPGERSAAASFTPPAGITTTICSGRQVAVVGTGASAIQFVPEIQPEVGRSAPVSAHAAVGAPAREPARSPRGWRARFARHPRLLGSPAARCSRCWSPSTSGSATRP